ncbi:hypothetical protein [Superficieibacter electus]|nr:hypothetical protein [Superficieibacter electus]
MNNLLLIIGIRLVIALQEQQEMIFITTLKICPYCFVLKIAQVVGKWLPQVKDIGRILVKIIPGEKAIYDYLSGFS